MTRKNNPIDFPYEIKSKTLDISLEEKDLGIWVTGALTLSKPTFDRCAKASKLLGFLCRSAVEIQTPDAHSTWLCLSCIRLRHSSLVPTVN
jgi:hypothetical protein